jgi:cytochrome c biogenesis protein CcmG/thiol:disulfide interchange protein DsbE
MSMDPDDTGTSQPGADAEAAAPAPHEAAAAGGPDPQEPRLSRKGAWLAMGAVILALALIWVAPGVDDGHEQGGEAAFVGMTAPMHFTLKDMNGVDVKLESFAGKVVVVNFWATWCGPCELEIPWLVELQTTYPDDVVVLGVSIDDTADLLKPFAAKMKMNYPVLVGVDRQDVQDAFGPLYGIPVSVFIDRDGRIARRHSGILEKAQLEREIKALL